MKSFIVTTAFIFFLLTTVLAAPGIGVLGSAFDMAKEVVPIPTPILDPLTAPVTAIVGGSDKKEKESDDDDEGDDDSTKKAKFKSFASTNALSLERVGALAIIAGAVVMY